MVPSLEVDRVLPLGTLDWLAIAVFALGWIGYAALFDWRPGSRPLSLNRAMALVRTAWMRQMLRRERIMDAMLIGHLINSVSFFASATVLLLAGLIGALASGDTVAGLIANLGITQPAPPALFEVKLVLLIAIFVYAFFKFTWAIRQFNYTVALIGAAPPLPVPPAEATRLADDAAGLMGEAIRSFNAGIRAYYFAFAVLGWLVHPLAFVVLTLWVVAVLSFRQLRSPAFRRVARYAERNMAEGA
jgi:uncharacterized membrane protein